MSEDKIKNKISILERERDSLNKKVKRLKNDIN
jgi:chaperonin cofactor prefoldin